MNAFFSVQIIEVFSQRICGEEEVLSEQSSGWCWR